MTLAATLGGLYFAYKSDKRETRMVREETMTNDENRSTNVSNFVKDSQKMCLVENL